MIKLGTGNTTLYLGDKKVKAAWLGGQKVYPNSFLELSASSLSFAAAGASLPLVITVNEGQAWTIAALPSGFSASVTSGTGPTSVTITAANNTSETTRTGSLTVISEELTVSCSLLQTAGTKVYGAWQNVRLETEGNITSFAASGGTAKIHMVVERTWTWNGVVGSGGTETNWSQPANVTVSDAIASVAADVLTIGSLGTTFKAATQITIEAGTASDSGTNNRKTLVITQAENTVVNEYANDFTYYDITECPASGTASSTGIRMRAWWNGTYSSGATARSQHRIIWRSATNGFQVGNATIGWGADAICRLINNTSTNRISGTAEGYLEGSPTNLSTGNYTVYQAAGVQIFGTPVVSAFTYPDIPASGGSVNPSSYSYYQDWTWNGVEGSGGRLTTGGSIVYSNGSGTVSAGSKGTTTSGRTEIAAITTRVDMNGVIGQNTMVRVYQAENQITSYTLNRLSANGSTIPYGGGTLAVTVRTYAYPRYSSGSTGATDTLADLGQPSDTIGVSWLTRQNMTKSGTGTYVFYYSAPQNSGTGDRTGNLTFSLSGKSTSLTVRQSGIPTYSLRIGAMTQAALNAIMPIGELNLSYNKSTPVVGSAGAIKLISLPSGVGNTAMVSWQGEGLQYFNLTSRMGGSSALVIKVMPSTQSGKILSGATTQRGTPVNLQGQVDANTTIVLGIYIEGEA